MKIKNPFIVIPPQMWVPIGIFFILFALSLLFVSSCEDYNEPGVEIYDYQLDSTEVIKPDTSIWVP